MGGLLSGVGKALVGAAEGYGTYLGQKAQIQMKREEDDILERRERALMALKEQASERMADSNLGRQIKLDRAQTGNKVAGDLALLGPRTEAQKSVDSAKSQADFEKFEKQQKILFQNELTKMERASGLKMEEQEKAAYLEQMMESYRDGVNIDRWEVDADSGELVGVTKRGGVYRGGDVKPYRPAPPTDILGLGTGGIAPRGNGSGAGSVPPVGRSGSGLPAVKSAEDYEKLPSGALYVDPDGNRRTKP